MLRIVAIGGGSLRAGVTTSIDRDIVRRTHKRRPRVVFVPTASRDDADYCQAFQRVYGRSLGCRVEVLCLVSDPPPATAIARTLAAADAIYVGGGNTLAMMKLWRRLKVDAVLLKAARRGAVLCGVSAGANCWFAWGLSDSMKFYSPEDWDYIRVRGLGLLNAVCCPHYHSERREGPFADLIQRHGGLGIALDDDAALAVDGAEYDILSASVRARAYRVIRRAGAVAASEIEPPRTSGKLRELLDARIV